MQGFFTRLLNNPVIPGPKATLAAAFADGQTATSVWDLLFAVKDVPRCPFLSTNHQPGVDGGKYVETGRSNTTALTASNPSDLQTWEAWIPALKLEFDTSTSYLSDDQALARAQHGSVSNVVDSWLPLSPAQPPVYIVQLKCKAACVKCSPPRIPKAPFSPTCM